jgi:hypothetical protein
MDNKMQMDIENTTVNETNLSKYNHHLQLQKTNLFDVICSASFSQISRFPINQLKPFFPFLARVGIENTPQSEIILKTIYQYPQVNTIILEN